FPTSLEDNERTMTLFLQNGAVTQKDTLNDDEFEPYLNAQPRQVGLVSELNKRRNP
uniref:Uncharacterized protein n=1 Tax=Sinocyclocheilus grahami TaxID=75366 RepID=A0A672PVG7_SINGR